MRKAPFPLHFSTALLAAMCLLTTTVGRAENASTPPPNPFPSISNTRDVQVGNASWYGQKFHRKRTASGVLFDVEALTAAHRSLPFHSWAKVTAFGSGKSVVVQINDRGPQVRNRLIDLSRAAADQLGILKRGVARVTVEPCESAASCLALDNDNDDNAVTQLNDTPPSSPTDQ